MTFFLRLFAPGAARWSLLVAGLVALGCQSDARRLERARMANLAERIDRLRRAENPDKRPLLEELARAECVGADACALKDLCVRAYQVHQRALDAIEGLAAQAQADASATPSVRERLQRAEQDLTLARELSQRCAEEQVRAVRKVLL